MGKKPEVQVIDGEGKDESKTFKKRSGFKTRVAAALACTVMSIFGAETFFDGRDPITGGLLVVGGVTGLIVTLLHVKTEGDGAIKIAYNQGFEDGHSEAFKMPDVKKTTSTGPSGGRGPKKKKNRN